MNGAVEASVIVCAVFLGAAAQTATGFGLGLIAVPLLSLVMPPGGAVAPSLLLPIPLNVWILIEGGLPRSRVNLLHLLVAGVLALPAGVYLVKVLPPSVLRMTIGSSTLVLTTLVMSGRQVLARQSPLVDSLVGAISGVASGATGMGGPLLGIVLLARIADKASYRAVMLLYLLVLNVCSLLLLSILTPVLAGIGPSLVFKSARVASWSCHRPIRVSTHRGGSPSTVCSRAGVCCGCGQPRLWATSVSLGFGSVGRLGRVVFGGPPSRLCARDWKSSALTGVARRACSGTSAT